uniref:LAGLIDADG homing endonuclease n=1 Tax=Romanomermis culicivorax TaxID=13658 RepID=A0A915IR37_ROMCU
MELSLGLLYVKNSNLFYGRYENPASHPIFALWKFVEAGSSCEFVVQSFAYSLALTYSDRNGSAKLSLDQMRGGEDQIFIVVEVMNDYPRVPSCSNSTLNMLPVLFFSEELLFLNLLLTYLFFTVIEPFNIICCAIIFIQKGKSGYILIPKKNKGLSIRLTVEKEPMVNIEYRGSEQKPGDVWELIVCSKMEFTKPSITNSTPMINIQFDTGGYSVRDIEHMLGFYSDNGYVWKLSTLNDLIPYSISSLSRKQRRVLGYELSEMIIKCQFGPKACSRSQSLKAISN